MSLDVSSDRILKLMGFDISDIRGHEDGDLSFIKTESRHILCFKGSGDGDNDCLYVYTVLEQEEVEWWHEEEWWQRRWSGGRWRGGRGDGVVAGGEVAGVLTVSIR
ncbi:hypothetical protein Pmani_009920 [Petrolisthes manimaculis]|uniref:Uncharacterized protein n=1 Tax=Petrolisthes manimaculis TaxID=1843537 RepID=A0AAE1Q5E5_9EUCA|nr:hypothetical protein Pmani_009920 [Petrolisthes manimaculis]